MFTSTILSSIPVNGTTTFHGEVTGWQFPAGMTWTHQAIATALTAATLDAKMARDLCPRNAFTRACRKLAEDRIISTLTDDGLTLTYQFDRTRFDSTLGHNVHDFEVTISLDTTSGVVACSDAAVLVTVLAELTKASEQRKMSDMTRLLQRLFMAQADLFPIKGGVYFVPQRYVSFIDQIQQFVTSLGGFMLRYPIAAGTVQGDMSVAVAVKDRLWSDLDNAEAVFTDMMEKAKEAGRVLTDKEWARAHEAVQNARHTIHDNQQYIAGQKAILEDRAALIAKRIRDIQNPPPPAPVYVPEPAVEVECYTPEEDLELAS